ncbi:4Fe-4S dicluster domain-containing protein [Desulfobaculum bizertense]|uniref:NADH-quinone oxidoreductase subunit I n=1 Tax=Desulfobaculum bizertense DSM 18034 TaxID=1121442 RepID=A0A1T4VWI8_9BACT|nr:4Fe-4S dicluster domain-containing protein [Desulfobaculum bizertense]SKA69380.1 NADH-quinone oxidoreductase subunit I [Desulfobaculum bizertense DSM 18034]
MSACTSAKQIGQTLKGLWSLAVGLKVTGKNYVSPQLTVHYPRETVDNIDSYHGHIELVGKPKDPGVPRCICCMLCVTSCPSSCITVVRKKEPKPEPAPETDAPAEMLGEVKKKKTPPAGKPAKTPSRWRVNYNLCSLCGTCVEVCPVKSIRFSSEAYLAGFSREEFDFDLLERLRRQAGIPEAEAQDGERKD